MEYTCPSNARALFSFFRNGQVSVRNHDKLTICWRVLFNLFKFFIVELFYMQFCSILQVEVKPFP